MGLIRKAYNLLPEKHRKAIALGAFLTAGAAKIYVVHKGAQMYRQYKAYQEGKGIGPGKFATLPRRRQAEILYYRRGQIRQLEGLYDRGRKHKKAFSLY